MLDRDLGGYSFLRGSRLLSERFLAPSSKHVLATNCSVVCLAIVNLTFARKSGKSQAYRLPQTMNHPIPDGSYREGDAETGVTTVASSHSVDH